MRLKDFLQAIFIILMFVLLLFYNMYSVGVKKIKDNWGEYKCKPSVMPFAGFFGHDAGKNFAECIKGMQTDYMGVLMQPINYTLSNVADGAEGIVTDLQSMRTMFSKVRDLTTGSFVKLYGIFLNIMRAFQKLLMKMRDTVNKLVGVVFVVMYFMLSAKDSMLAIIDGPVGSMIDIVCFHPDTLVMKKDKTLVKMKDMKLDDIIYNGSKVKGVLNIRNYSKSDKRYSPLYKLYSNEMKREILVTGGHKIQHPITKEFIFVQNYEKAVKTDIETETLSCLITDDHLIKLGEHTFWDWED